MAFGHGKDSVFWLDNAAGSLTNISAYCKSAAADMPGQVNETTTLGKTSRTFIGGLLDGTISVEGLWDPTVDAIMFAARGVTKSFELGPEGGTTGDIKYSGECFGTSYKVNPAVDGVVTFSATFQCSDTVTRGTFA